MTTPKPEMTRNLVTDLRPEFPYDEGGNPHLAAFRANGWQYILQFEDGSLIGAVVIAEGYAATLAGILANPQDDRPKLEVATR